MCVFWGGGGTHHIVEDKAAVGQLEVLEEAVELEAVEGAPGAVQVVPGLSLLPGVIVVQELGRDTTNTRLMRCQTSLQSHRVAHQAERGVRVATFHYSPDKIYAVSAEVQ